MAASMLTIKFGVKGKPEPAGSKRSIQKPGDRFPRVFDDNPKAEPWKKTVKSLAKVAMIDARNSLQPKPFDGPVYVRFEFLHKRPASHRLPSGGLSANGRKWPAKTTKPDALKLARAVEDAMTGVVYTDDAQIVEEEIIKRWASEDGVNITVSELTFYDEAISPVPDEKVWVSA